MYVSTGTERLRVPLNEAFQLHAEHIYISSVITHCVFAADHRVGGWYGVQRSARSSVGDGGQHHAAFGGTRREWNNRIAVNHHPEQRKPERSNGSLDGNPWVALSNAGQRQGERLGLDSHQ